MTELERLEAKLESSRQMQNLGGGYVRRVEAIQRAIANEKAKQEGGNDQG